MRRMSKSAVRVAREAPAAGRAALPEYGSRYPRRGYTQPPLFALPVLRQVLRADYRGVVALVAEWSELRHALGLAKVPHHSTLAHASRRILADAEAGGPSGAPRPRWSAARAQAGPDRPRAGGRGGRFAARLERARDAARERLLRRPPGEREGPSAARLAGAHRRRAHPLAPDPRRRARRRAEPGHARLHPGDAANGGAGRHGCRPGRRGRATTPGTTTACAATSSASARP